MTDERNETPALTAEEREIIEWFRRMTRDRQEDVLKMARQGDTPKDKTRRMTHHRLNQSFRG